MTKLTKSKLHSELKSHKSIKKDLNLFKHRKYLYNPENHMETHILQEQCSLNNNIVDTQKKKKTSMEKSTVYDTEVNTKTSMTLRSTQNKNQSRHADLFNTIDTNCDEKLNKFSKSVGHTTLSCCNSKLFDSNLHIGSSSHQDMVERHQKHVHRVIEMPSKSKQKSLATIVKKHNSTLLRKQKDSNIKETKSEKIVLKYSQGRKKSTGTINSVNIMNLTHTLEANQDDLVPSYTKCTSSLIHQERIVKDKMLKIPRIKNIKKEDLNHVELHNKTQAQSHSEHLCCENDCGEETAIIVPNFCDKNFTYDTMLQHHVEETKTNKNVKSVSRKECVLNSLENRVRTRSMDKQDCKELQKNTNFINSITDISKTKAIECACINKESLCKPHKNISVFSSGNCDTRRKSSEAKIPDIIEVKEETIVQHNVQMTHFHSKSKVFSCNLPDNSSYDKVSKNNEDHSILNIVQQQRKLQHSVRENKKEQSSDVQKNKNITQTIVHTNLQDLVDSKLKNDCNFSMKIKKRNKYEINKSVEIQKCKAKVHSKVRKKEIIKSECHIQIRNNKQKTSNCLKKCEHTTTETMRKTHFTNTLKRENFQNSFNITTQERKSNIRTNEKIINNKKLVIPLIKMEDLPLSELSQLIHIPNYIENKMHTPEDNKAECTTKHIKGAQCSVHKEYKITRIKNNKIYLTNKSLENCKNQRTDGLLCEKTGKGIHLNQEVDTNFSVNNFLSINKFSKKSLQRKKATKRNSISNLPNEVNYFKTEAVCQQVNENKLMLNMSLKKTSNLNRISSKKNDRTFVNHESVCKNKCIRSNKNIDNEVKSLKFEANKCRISTNDEISKAETLQNNKSKLQSDQLLQNILNFFIKNKRRNINGTTVAKPGIININKLKHKVRKSVAICVKCKQVLNLLQQFSNKTNFTKDEPLQIECTLCNLHMNSLSHFQHHIMDVHLQCEGNSSISKNQFVVDIINLREDMRLNGKDSHKKYVFECCCCLKMFSRMGNFKRHIQQVHYNCDDSMSNMKSYKQRLITETVGTDALSNNFYPNMVNNNIAEVPNEVEENSIDTNNHIEEYCINKKEMNLTNKNNFIVNIQVKQKEMSKMKIKNNSNLNDISPIAKLKFSGFINDQTNQECKEPKAVCETFAYFCNMCTKRYNTKHAFLLHMSKHATNSDSCMNKDQKTQKIVQANNTTKFENNVHLPSTSTKGSQDYSNNYNVSNILTSVVMNRHLKETKCYITTEKAITGQINSAVDVIPNRLVENNNVFDCNYILHVNCTQKFGKGIKRQKLLKCNINIAKRNKTETTGQVVDNEIKDKFSNGYASNVNYMCNTNTEKVISCTPKEIRCNICDKKFNSERILKEHMFFIHDSVLADQELLNLLPCNNTEEKVYMQGNDNFKNEHKFSKQGTSRICMKKENEMYETVICEMLRNCSINKRNRKWRCNPCKENFALIRNYLRHKYYIHNDVSVVHVCDNCNKVLTSVAMVNIHMCTNVSSWNCKRCNQNFSNGISLTQHNINYHFETAGPHICNECKLSFLTLHMLEKHKPIHSLPDECNINFVDTFLSAEYDSPCNLSNRSDCYTECVEGNQNMVNHRLLTYTNQGTKNLNGWTETDDIFLNTCTNSNISLQYDVEEIFKCKHCNVTCLTKKQLIFHLKKWHNINVEICKLCEKLYIMDELTRHLINFHISLNDLDLAEDNTKIQLKYNRIEDFQNNVVKLLGLERLITLYEYQRFDTVPKNKCFNCTVCLMEFLNTQSYKIHYLKFHDTICLLCNIEFEYNYQAFEHKIKIHLSVDSYLWVVQKITSIILQFYKYGNTLEDIILQCSETRLHGNENDLTETLHISESFWLNNSKLKKLNDKEFLHTSENFASFIALPENVNATLIVM